MIELEDEVILLIGPLALLQSWVQSVHPTLPALLTRASGDERRAPSPFGVTLCFDPCSQFFVFFFCPGSLDKTRFEDLGPSVEALDWASSTEAGRELGPAGFSVLFNSLLEFLIFIWAPWACFGRPDSWHGFKTPLHLGAL